MKKSDIKKANILLTLVAYIFNVLKESHEKEPGNFDFHQILREKILTLSNMIQKLCMEKGE